MAKQIKDFSRRPVEERATLVSVSWCDVCEKEDLGIHQPVEYEENGKLYIEGCCPRCGGPVLSEVIIHYANKKKGSDHGV